MSLLFTDNSSTETVNFGSGSSLDSPNLTAATLMFWVYPTTVANALRQVIGKKGGPNTGWVVIKRGSDGTNWAWLGDRATTDCGVDITGVQANVWQFMAYSWNVGTSAFKSYLGTLTSAATDISAGIATGSGAQVDDSAESLIVGVSNQNATGMRMAHVHIVNRVLTLGEIQAQQFRPRPISGSVLFSYLGYNGTGTQTDWSGTGNSGTVSGPTVTDHVPIPFRRARGLWVPRTVAAASVGSLWWWTKYGDVTR